MRRDNLIIDCFAGGGGASVGIEMALGRSADIAVNHDPYAILMHKTNHPETLHLTEDIFKVDLKKYVNGRHVDLMWASPDCTSHSKAKGGKPRCQGLRILPWAVYKHVRQLLPDVVIMENVEEIQKWGPLDPHGRPIKDKEGEDYKKFISAMKALGYVFDSKELVAADYGAPTTRKRWYAIFRRDGKPIIWPMVTHSKEGKVPGTKPWEPVWKCLDLSDFGQSIFDRKKPLAENTLKRIGRGLQKFVFENDDPFIAYIDKAFAGNYAGCGSDAKKPLSTITTVDHNRLITPYIVPIGYGERTGQKPRVNSTKEPIGTLVASGRKHYLCNPYLIQYHSEQATGQVRGQSVKDPAQTIDTSNRYAMVTAFLTKFYKTGTGQSLFEPIHTITTSAGHFGQVSVLLIRQDDLLKNNIDKDVAKKCTWVSQFIIEYYGSGTGQSLNEPLHTVVSKDRFAMITVLGNKYVLADIFLRMLKPEELKKAQGFPDDYIIDRDYKWRKYPVSEQVKRIGNSVVPIMAEQLVKSNCGYLKVGERQRGMATEYESEGQLRITTAGR